MLANDDDVEATSAGAAFLAANRSTFEHELNIVQTAIGLVATNRSLRVGVAGLTFSEEILPDIERVALISHVKLRPLWHENGRGCDFMVETDD